MKTELTKLAGKMIALGHGTRKGRADLWSGVIQLNGQLYSVSVNWPDNAEAHEVGANVREIKSTTRPIWTAEEIERK
jgi:hypothetical protein